jgi:hypothetical protein
MIPPIKTSGDSKIADAVVGNKLAGRVCAQPGVEVVDHCFRRAEPADPDRNAAPIEGEAHSNAIVLHVGNVVHDRCDPRPPLHRRHRVLLQSQCTKSVCRRRLGKRVLNQHTDRLTHVQACADAIDRIFQDVQHRMNEVVEIEELPATAKRRNDEGELR